MTSRRRQLITQTVALLAVLVRVSDASYCGQAGVPFSLEILSNGQPVLGCARPSCFGWNAKGQRAADPAQFYRIGQQTDGFIRASDKKGPVVRNATLFQPQFAVCERSYYSNRCAAPNQWVGGILPSAIIKSDNAMRLMCCSYDKLNEATNEDRVPLRSGQAVQGGEVRNSEGRQHAFEYIANIERQFDREGVIYTVTFKEFPCLPEPNGPAGVETDAATYLIENINAVDPHSAPVPHSNRAAGVPVSVRQEIPVFIEQKSFAEQTFQLPHTLPQEDSVVTSVASGQENLESRIGSVRKAEGTAQPKQKSRKYGVPVAQPYEWESADEITKRGSIDATIGTRDDQFKQIVDGGKPAQTSTDQGVERYAPAVQDRNAVQSTPTQQPYQHSLLDPFGLFRNHPMLSHSLTPAAHSSLGALHAPPASASHITGLGIPARADAAPTFPAHPMSGLGLPSHASLSLPSHPVLAGLPTHQLPSLPAHTLPSLPTPTLPPHSLGSLSLPSHPMFSLPAHPSSPISLPSLPTHGGFGSAAAAASVHRPYGPTPAPTLSFTHPTMHPLFTHVFSMPTLPTPAPLPTHPLFQHFAAPGVPSVAAAPQHTALPQSHGLPLLRIPTPEEVENSIPESGKRLITRVAHTLLGYHRYTR